MRFYTSALYKSVKPRRRMTMNQEKFEGSAAIVDAINRFHGSEKRWRFVDGRPGNMSGNVLARLTEGGFLLEIIRPTDIKRFSQVSAVYRITTVNSVQLFCLISEEGGQIQIDFYSTKENDRTTLDEAPVYRDEKFVTLMTV